MTDALTVNAEHWCSFRCENGRFKLQVRTSPTREQLDEEILLLWQIDKDLPMAIAELIVLGEQLFGQKYAPAQLATGRAYDTLAGWVRVFKAVPKTIWRDDLSFSYHKAVAYKELPEDTKADYLGRAASGEFETAADLNHTIREEQGLIESPILLSVRCPKCGEQLDTRYCNRYCSVCGAKPIEWAEAYWELLSRAHTQTDIEQEAQ